MELFFTFPFSYKYLLAYLIKKISFKFSKSGLPAKLFDICGPGCQLQPYFQFFQFLRLHDS